jgi:hypothetical protein
MIDKLLTLAATGYASYKFINMALLKLAFKGEPKRVPLLH